MLSSTAPRQQCKHAGVKQPMHNECSVPTSSWRFQQNLLQLLARFAPDSSSPAALAKAYYSHGVSMLRGAVQSRSKIRSWLLGQSALLWGVLVCRSWGLPCYVLRATRYSRAGDSAKVASLAGSDAAWERLTTCVIGCGAQRQSTRSRTSLVFTIL